MSRLSTLALAFLLVAAASAVSAAPRPTPRTGGSAVLSQANYPVERYTLDNGLTVILHEDHTVPVVCFWQWYKVGSHNERQGITGLSHFFEHMMFNGSKNVPLRAQSQLVSCMVKDDPLIARSMPLSVTPRVFGISIRPLMATLCRRSTLAGA